MGTKDEGMSKNKYLITLWVDWYDYNCQFKKFSIEYEAADLNEASRKLDKIEREIINEELKGFENFAVIQSPPEKRPISVDVNKNNKVIRRVCRTIGDGNRYNCIYYNFDLIKVPVKTKVDENLFNLENCEQEVRSYFKYRYNQCQKKVPSKKRFIGMKELAKSKLGFSLSYWIK